MLTVITYTPTVKLVLSDGSVIPCIARSYKDGQWRQCKPQSYTLHPLVAEPLIQEPIDETICDIKGLPIYVAKCIEPAPIEPDDPGDVIEYIELVTNDGCLLFDENNKQLVIGG